MKILNENMEEIAEYDLTKGSLTETVRIRPDAAPIDNETKFTWEDDDYEPVMIYTLYDWAREGRENPADIPSAEDTLLEMMADHEYRICMMELGGTDTV